jgi:HD-like signal output (HDOD) protein
MQVAGVIWEVAKRLTVKVPELVFLAGCMRAVGQVMAEEVVLIWMVMQEVLLMEVLPNQPHWAPEEVVVRVEEMVAQAVEQFLLT